MADEGPSPIVEVVGPSLVLPSGATRTVEATIHVPKQPANSANRDWRLGALAVASWYGHGDSVRSWLEGAGAGSLRGGARGDGTANLVSHPFDACPANGPCETSVVLVSAFTPDRYGSSGGDPESVWNLRRLGVPPGTTVTFGQPVDRWDSEAGLGSAVVPTVVATAIGACVVLLLVRRRRRAHVP